jgi:hypothetical protein
MPEPINLTAVFTGDSKNFHIFQIVDENFVGSMYIKKKSDNGIPETVGIALITPSRDKGVWKECMQLLLDRTREGSKAKQKLIRTLKSYE